MRKDSRQRPLPRRALKGRLGSLFINDLRHPAGLEPAAQEPDEDRAAGPGRPPISRSISEFSAGHRCETPAMGIDVEESVLRTIAVPLALAVALLAGRAAAQDTEVRTFSNLDTAPKKFVLVPAKGQDAIQQDLYAKLVRDQLNARGWRETAFVAADVAIFVQYQLGPNRNAALKHPTRRSSVEVKGVTASSATVTTRAAGQTADAATGQAIQQERTLRIEMFAARPFVRDMTMVPVYDAIVRSTARANSQDSADPALVGAAFEQLPGGSRDTGRDTLAAQ